MAIVELVPVAVTSNLVASSTRLCTDGGRKRERPSRPRRPTTRGGPRQRRRRHYLRYLHSRFE